MTTIPVARSRLQSWNGRLLGWLILLAAGVGISLSGCGSDPSSAVSTFPLPGSRVAAPQTQIEFRGVSLGQLGQVEVTGSRTGPHAGRLMGDSDGRGASFLPVKPFKPGEVVTVRTKRHLPGLRRRSWHFGVADPAGPIPNGPLPPARRLPGDVLTFRSRPDLQPPAVEIVRRSARAASGDVFVTPQQGPLQNGPMIIDAAGELLWFSPIPKGDVASDFRIQRYHGKPVLTWWQGINGAGVGAGVDVVDDSAYRQIAVVHGGNGLWADLHEFTLTPQGNALITAYYPVYWDGSSVHGPKRMIVLDSVVQEIDVKTGLVLFQWDSLDHVPLTDSYEPLPKTSAQPYDYFHVNSVQQDKDGDFIISARNTWAAYKVKPTSGQTVWTLGGKRSSFRLGQGASFAFQHDVRVRSQDDRTITVFDDGAGPPVVHEQSRGLTLRLDPRRRTATLVKADAHPPPLLTRFEGNLQQLSDGDQFLGWGQQPYFTEFDPDAQVVFDGRFVDGNSTYRAYRFRWTATPAAPPSIAASTTDGTTTVYVSWNGATTVASWRILAGPSATALRQVATAPRQGFETQLQISAARYVAAQALDSRGHILSTSHTVSPS